MKKQLFHTGWTISRQPGKSMVEAMMSSEEEKEPIVLPYDAMIHEAVAKDTKNAGQTGYYPGKMYYYTKEFEAPQDWEDKLVQLEFEGSYGKTLIYLNGDYVGEQKYGYTNFYVTLNDSLNYGGNNHLEVVVNNEQEKNSRWYSGSGLYRNVQMYVANEVYVPADGVRIQTPEVSGDEAVVDVQIELNNRGLKKHAVKVEVTISNQNGGMEAKRVCPVTLFADGTEHIEQRLVIQNPKLWSVEEPNLYQCKIQILDGNKVWDEAEDTFGIRTLRLNPYSGLCVNGEPVKLRGACIHHDHGIIGAAELRDAETRKIKKLKEAGFNCIRMAHHPAGKTLLEVCDREGMLVMDEFSDMWTRTKNANDFANDFHENWEQIIEAMVAKDYNHPSVILYGMGNEIQEAGTAKGAQTGRKIHQKIKSLDPARYTTNAVNGIFACGDRFMEVVGQSMQQLGIPIPDMQQAARDGQQSSEQQSSAQGGSDALNSMMSVMVGPLADAIALHPIMTEMTEEFMETMDVAGYNYLTGRHAKEHELYPHRVVLGTETFPGDIANLWKTVQENTHVIGDMTWTGYDYLGEAGIGIFHYDGGVNFQAMYPERAAYIGDLDILGNRRPISYYREIIYGLRKTPYIGVERVNRYGKNIGQTPWMWKDNIASWTWNGYEGKTAVIDVLSDADEVELFLNGVSKGRKAAGKANDYMAVFQITYEPGELKAVAVRDGKACESFALNTAGKAEKLSIDTDRTTMEANGQDLAYVMIGLQDEAGNQNLWEEKEIAVQIEGAGSLAGFGSAEPSCERSYFDTVCKTYDGYVMAVIRAGLELGTTTLTVSAEGLEPLTISIEEI
ncbi:MAG: glycoside hydrolase family 2 protein [Ruminococcus sp.]|uniref:Glycoside hydrolase family 2 protein n=1 Tax=Schaedlerella arabinosiphila TaxID=2044587 RepID=A0A3R8JS52_9FIRM|nr:glycoside hydrolase family 2 TIM barrel-domain containing protein [Schaedlerella arabinosiphila]MCI8722364.1 glycoside hydrolase family 2 protein [Ruminococcus sp.]RRK34778.1 glycoside hydrolase family 2 protein [Schaedlerella arabinosiphila]